MTIRKDFGFIGRLCLDFAQTGDMGWGTAYERLVAPSELRRWLALSPLQVAVGRVTHGDLKRAKALRSAIWGIGQALLKGTTPRRTDIRRLNAVARGATLVRCLSGTGLVVEWHRPTLSAALVAIARDAVALFGDPDQRARLRRCENPECRVVFYDDSRPGSRRWCASNRCGDRIRSRDYRRRHG